MVLSVAGRVGLGLSLDRSIRCGPCGAEGLNHDGDNSVCLSMAMKCNSDPVVCKFLADAGVGFDCASKVEMQQILQLGVHPSRIVYANPCKASTHLQFALNNTVDLMTFDDLYELVKIQNHYPNARLLLRIQSSKEHKAKHDFNKKFGCDPDDAPGLLRTAMEMSLDVVGISFHVGSLPEEVSSFASTIKEANDVFTYGEMLGFDMQILDIGGGFPGIDSENMTFEMVAETVNEALERHFPVARGTEIIAEPGRYLVTSAFTLAVNVIAKRVQHVTTKCSGYTLAPSSLTLLVSRDKDYSEGDSDEGTDLDDSIDEEGDIDKGQRKIYMYYVNDGIYGAFNNVFTDHAIVFPELVSKLPCKPKTFPSMIWGPTCDGLDCVIHECQLPELDVGQWLYFHNMGAYTVSLSCGFNGIERPRLFYVCSDTCWNHVHAAPNQSACSSSSSTDDWEVCTHKNAPKQVTLKNKGKSLTTQIQHFSSAQSFVKG
ncbi:ornithine decarboxylase 1 [Plakobranchus ocellatus]|uniref:Ornithine decarboxylase 1 n=1 Tax=Plakobranchus ocellatus TaxID=259542 RepID=A0AAV3YEU8_9GAST|nr:ornithine decarboxylase 1 [Plakobranchus ocellatus]